MSTSTALLPGIDTGTERENCPHCGSPILPVPKDARLTPRQLEVLALIAQGYKATEIADQLKISRRTAEFHRAMIIRELRLHSTAELTLYALGQRLI